MYTMYTRVIGLSVCLALALLGCGDDDGGGDAANASCTPGQQSTPSGNKQTDPCPQNDMASMCMPFPQFVAVTECCNAVGANCPAVGKWRRSCQCISTNPQTMAGRGGGGSGAPGMPKCGDGMVQPAAPFNEKCDPGDGMQKAAIVMASCGSLNMGTGMVMCDPRTCQYDTSMCSGSTGGGGSGGN
jgi:hypothetical protein